MAIYVETSNAALLKDDRSVVELYKGSNKIFGYSSAQGEIISVGDVHPVEHKLKVKLQSDTVTNFSSVQVTRCGKNIIPYPYVTGNRTTNGVTFATDENGALTINGTLTIASMAYVYFNKSNGILKDGVTYRMSKGVLIRYKDENGTTKWANTNNILTWKKEYTFEMCYSLIEGTYTNTIIYPQLEIGAVATEYEPPTPISQIVTANSDGTVEGLTSLSPNMTLYADADGVKIDCRYVKG